MLATPKLSKISNALVKHLPNSHLTLGICASTLMFMMAAPAIAQESNSDVSNVDGDVEVIEVSGLRASVTRSLNEKKNTTAIVDAIAAADFGELPGLSLSDIIENVSGASGHRLKGSQNEISIRGLGSYWGYSTFNGRTITNAGPGRAVNFKKFPSELVDKVVIYKSQQANLVEGGISGTIDVSSLRAVDYGKPQTSLEIQGVYNDYFSDVEGPGVSPWGSRVTFSTVQQFELDNGGEIGFSLGYTKSKDSNPEENYGGNSQAYACALRDSAGNALSDNGRNCDDARSGRSDQAVSAGRVGRSPTPGDGTDGTVNLADFDRDSIFIVPGDAFWRSVEDRDDREGVVATVQWVLNDKWDINFDYQKSELEYTEIRHEVGLDNRRFDLEDHVIGEDNTLLYATGRSRARLNGEDRNQVDDYEGAGISVDYTPTDNLTLSADLSFSESYRYRLRHRADLRSTDNVYYSVDARNTNVPTLTWLDSNRLGPDDAGFNASEAFDATDIRNFQNGSRPARLRYRRSHDERNDDIWAFKFDGNYELNDNEFFSAVSAGFRYSREHLLDYKGNDVSLRLTDGTQRNGSTDTDDSSWDRNNPELAAALVNGVFNNCVVDHTNDRLFDEENAGDASSFASYSPKCFIGEILDRVPGTPGTGFFDIGEREDGRSGDDVDVREDILSAYVMADIETEIGGYAVTGNVGVRVVRTEESSTGFGDKAFVTTLADGTFETREESNEVVTLDSNYTEVLPSLNLTFELQDDVFLRTGLSRSLARFPLNAFSSGVSLTTCDGAGSDDNQCETDFNQSVTGLNALGNHIDPFTSNNLDLSLEYYPSQDTAVTLAMYYKRFKGGIENVVTNRDITVVLDGVDTVIPNVETQVNQTADQTSTVKGYELNVNQNLSFLPGFWSGFGFNLAYNHAINDFVTPEIASPGIAIDAGLFGFSKDVASSSIFWEGEKLTVRLLYKTRSRYFQPNGLPFPTRSHRFVQDQEYLDMSVKYKLTKNVSLSMKALNLLDEPQVYTRTNDTLVADYSRSGAKLFFGVKAKF